jgi:hypothetical protein
VSKGNSVPAAGWGGSGNAPVSRALGTPIRPCACVFPDRPLTLCCVSCLTGGGKGLTGVEKCGRSGPGAGFEAIIGSYDAGEPKLNSKPPNPKPYEAGAPAPKLTPKG